MSDLLKVGDEYIADKFISPMYRRFFPDFMYNIPSYNRMFELYKSYLEFLEQGTKPYWVLSHLSELTNIQHTLEDTFNKFRDQYAPDFKFEDFPNMDARKFLANAKDFYSKKGTEGGFSFLFNMLGTSIDLINPIDNTLYLGDDSTLGNERLVDSFYYTPFTYDIVTNLPYATWTGYMKRLNHPIGTQMFGTYLVILSDQLVHLDFINLNIPNDSTDLVHSQENTPASGNFTLDVSGDISKFPISGTIRISDEDMGYSSKGSNFFIISNRGINGTKEQAATDFSVMSVDAVNNNLIYNTRLNHYTGKVIQFTTDGILPTPLKTNTNYVVSLVEIKSKLIGNINSSITSLTIDDTSLYPDTGYLYINGEYVQYTSKTSTTFTIVRGQLNSIAKSHTDNSNVYLWTRVVKISENITDALNNIFINIIDQGTGTHTVVGPGLEVTTFNGMYLIRPQAISLKNVNAFTTYETFNQYLFPAYIGNLTFKTLVTALPDQTYLNVSHPFSLGERVRFVTTAIRVTSTLTAVTTTIPVTSTTGYTASGFIEVGGEFIQYSGITATSFTGCTRGVLGTVARTHVINTRARPRMFTDVNDKELDSIYYVRRFSSTEFELVTLDENDTVDSVIMIHNIPSGPVFVELYDVEKSTKYTSPTSIATQGSAVATLARVYGRSVVFNVSTGALTDGTITVTDGINATSISVNIFPGISNFSLISNDFSDITFNELENYNVNDINRLNTRFSMVSPELNQTIATRYYIPTLGSEVGLLPLWQPDTTTPIGSYVQFATGAVYNNTISFNKGIIRGYIDNFTPIIEVVPGNNLSLSTIDAGEIIATVGSNFITGNFAVLPFIPSSRRVSVEVAGIQYVVSGQTNPSTLTLLENVSISGLNSGSSYIQDSKFYPTILNSNATIDRRPVESEKFGIKIPNIKKIIKLTTNANITISTNWVPSTASVFSSTAKGHLTQTITGATGIIRAKRTVETFLTSSINTSDSIISVNTAIQFPTKGRLRIGSEYINYTGNTGTTFTGCIRGTFNTIPANHLLNDIVVSNNLEEIPNEIYVEVISGTFTTDATSIITTGNGSNNDNEPTFANSILNVYKNDPKIGDSFIISDNSTTDLNRYRYYTITSIETLQNQPLLIVENIISQPVGTLGTANYVL